MSPEQFRAWVAHHGLSWAQAGRLLGKHPETIWRYETGKTALTRQQHAFCLFLSEGDNLTQFQHLLARLERV